MAPVRYSDPFLPRGLPLRYLTTQEVARYCHVSSVTVGKWIDAGHLRGHRTPGGHRRVTRSDLVAFMRTRNMPVPLDLQGPGQPLTILVADAEAPFREEVARRLVARLPGSQVEEAASGTEALVKVGQHRPALVVLDLGLSDVDASEVCRRLPELAGLDGLWIVAVSRRAPAGTAAPPSGASAVVQRSAGADAVAAAAGHALQSLAGAAPLD